MSGYRLTQVDNITIMQLSNPLENGLQYFSTGSHRNLIFDHTQEILFQMLIYEYSLVWNLIQWSPYASRLR